MLTMLRRAKSFRGLNCKLFIAPKKNTCTSFVIAGIFRFLPAIPIFSTPPEYLFMKTAIMGFGNPTRSDDAVGIHAIELLRSRLAMLPNRDNISLLDMGTSAFEVLFQLKGHERIILIDAVVNTGESVGTLYKVPASEIESTPQDDPMVFLHSIKWDQALSYAKKILRDEYPSDIQAYLIAVDNTRMDINLSDAAKQAAERVVELICEVLHE